MLKRRIHLSEDSSRPVTSSSSRPPRPVGRTGAASSRSETHKALEGIVQGLKRRSTIKKQELPPSAERLKENLERVVSPSPFPFTSALPHPFLTLLSHFPHTSLSFPSHFPHTSALLCTPAYDFVSSLFYFVLTAVTIHVEVRSG